MVVRNDVWVATRKQQAAAWENALRMASHARGRNTVQEVQKGLFKVAYMLGIPGDVLGKHVALGYRLHAVGWGSRAQN